MQVLQRCALTWSSKIFREISSFDYDNMVSFAQMDSKS